MDEAERPGCFDGSELVRVTDHAHTRPGLHRVHDDVVEGVRVHHGGLVDDEHVACFQLLPAAPAQPPMSRHGRHVEAIGKSARRDSGRSQADHGMPVGACGVGQCFHCGGLTRSCGSHCAHDGLVAQGEVFDHAALVISQRSAGTGQALRDALHTGARGRCRRGAFGGLQQVGFEVHHGRRGVGPCVGTFVHAHALTVGQARSESGCGGGQAHDAGVRHDSLCDLRDGLGCAGCSVAGECDLAGGFGLHVALCPRRAALFQPGDRGTCQGIDVESMRARGGWREVFNAVARGRLRAPCAHPVGQ